MAKGKFRKFRKFKRIPPPPKPVPQEGPPKVSITPGALERLNGYIAVAEGEISGLGVVEKIGPKEFLITEVLIFKQECSSSESTFDNDGLAEFLTQAITQGRDIGRFKCWWHSHANMGTFWSNTDKETIEAFNNDWMISIVGNKKGEFLVRLDVYQSVRLTVDSLTLYVDRIANPELIEELKTEVKEKVTFKKYSPPLVVTYVKPLNQSAPAGGNGQGDLEGEAWDGYEQFPGG